MCQRRACVPGLSAWAPFVRARVCVSGARRRARSIYINVLVMRKKQKGTGASAAAKLPVRLPHPPQHQGSSGTLDSVCTEYPGTLPCLETGCKRGIHFLLSLLPKSCCFVCFRNKAAVLQEDPSAKVNPFA